MEGVRPLILAMMFIAAHMPCAFPSPTTAPAFLWSPHNYGSSRHTKEVDYRTISPQDLTKSVMADGGWSNLVCSRESFDQNVDFALVFVGKKLQSSDISRTKHLDPALLDLLKLSFTSSNFSMAFPYVALSDEGPMENSLVSGFIDSCGELNHVTYVESCSVRRGGLKKLEGLDSLMGFMGSRMERTVSKPTDLIVFCSEEVDQVQAEGDELHKLVSFLEQLGARYTVLYASDPYSLQYSGISRFLAEDTAGNGSANSSRTHCDGICQIKSSFLEGIFVGIVLLIILISGLCCMAGIDTPRRFESPQES